MPDYPQSPRAKSKPLRGGLFQRTVVRELAGTALLVFSILLSIIVLTQMIRLLGESVSGLLAVEGVMVMVGFGMLNYLPVLLSISLFLAVLLTLSRIYRDSEMVVWCSSGLGLTRWMRPVLTFSLPVVLVIALLSLVLTPWALSTADEFKRRLDSRDDVARATPGVFRESKQADRVFFLEDVDVEQKRVGNIFVRSIQNGREGAMVAKEGYQETAANGDRFLVLVNGMRYEGIPGQADYKIARFERYAMRIEPNELRQEVPNLRAHSTLYLLQHPTAQNVAELEWRVGLPLSAFILALLGIPLSYINPRAGRSLNLILALIIYMIYNNMISVTNSWVSQGKMGMVGGLVGIHAVMLGVTLLLFYHRSSAAAWRWLRK